MQKVQDERESIISDYKIITFGISNPEIDLRILLNYSKKFKNEIILSNFNIPGMKVLQQRIPNDTEHNEIHPKEWGFNLAAYLVELKKPLN